MFFLTQPSFLRKTIPLFFIKKKKFIKISWQISSMWKKNNQGLCFPCEANSLCFVPVLCFATKGDGGYWRAARVLLPLGFLGKGVLPPLNPPRRGLRKPGGGPLPFSLNGENQRAKPPLGINRSKGLVGFAFPVAKQNSCLTPPCGGASSIGQRPFTVFSVKRKPKGRFATKQGSYFFKCSLLLLRFPNPPLGGHIAFQGRSKAAPHKPSVTPPMFEEQRDLPSPLALQARGGIFKRAGATKNPFQTLCFANIGRAGKQVLGGKRSNEGGKTRYDGAKKSPKAHQNLQNSLDYQWSKTANKHFPSPFPPKRGSSCKAKGLLLLPLLRRSKKGDDFPLPPIPPLLATQGQSKGVALQGERSNFLLCFANQRGTKQPLSLLSEESNFLPPIPSLPLLRKGGVAIFFFALQTKGEQSKGVALSLRSKKGGEIKQRGCFAREGRKMAQKYFWNQTFDKGRLKNFVLWFFLKYGEHKTVQLVEELKTIGFQYATKAGISLGIEDLKIPAKKSLLIFEAENLSMATIKQFKRGEITEVERFQHLIDTWHRTSERLKVEVIENFEETDVLNPVYMMAFSGARGNISQVRQLVGMRGLMSNPQGQIIDFPIRRNFREGLTLTEYIISSYGARKGIVDTALRTANAGYLTRRLVDVAQHVIISSTDCGTSRGIFLTDMKEGNKTIYSLQNRLIGRVLARDLVVQGSSVKKEGVFAFRRKQELRFHNQIKIASKNSEISGEQATLIALNHKKVFVRSPLTCQTNKLVCQLCYGWSLAQGNLVSIGEAIGVVAAQSIGEPGTQLTMRTFHTGGVFSGNVSDQIKAPFDGIVVYKNPIAGKLIRTPEGKIAFLTKTEGSFSVYQSSLTLQARGGIFFARRTPSLALTPLKGGKEEQIGGSSCKAKGMQTKDPLSFALQPKRGTQSKAVWGGSLCLTPPFGEVRREANKLRFGASSSCFATKGNGRPRLDRQKQGSNSQQSTQKKFKIPFYTLLFLRNHEKVLNKQVIAQISPINRQKTATDQAELTIKAEISGLFYSKNLEMEETKVGPVLKDTLADNEGPHPILDTINRAWNWGYAWILSGKIYQLPLPSSFFPIFGDFINQKTYMNSIKWNIPGTFGSPFKLNMPLNLNIFDQNRTLLATQGALRKRKLSPQRNSPYLLSSYPPFRGGKSKGLVALSKMPCYANLLVAQQGASSIGTSPFFFKGSLIKKNGLRRSLCSPSRFPPKQGFCSSPKNQIKNTCQRLPWKAMQPSFDAPTKLYPSIPFGCKARGRVRAKKNLKILKMNLISFESFKIFYKNLGSKACGQCMGTNGGGYFLRLSEPSSSFSDTFTKYQNDSHISHMRDSVLSFNDTLFLFGGLRTSTSYHPSFCSSPLFATLPLALQEEPPICSSYPPFRGVKARDGRRARERERSNPIPYSLPPPFATQGERSKKGKPNDKKNLVPPNFSNLQPSLNLFLNWFPRRFRTKTGGLIFIEPVSFFQRTGSCFAVPPDELLFPPLCFAPFTACLEQEEDPCKRDGIKARGSKAEDGGKRCFANKPRLQSKARGVTHLSILKKINSFTFSLKDSMIHEATQSESSILFLPFRSFSRAEPSNIEKLGPLLGLQSQGYGAPIFSPTGTKSKRFETPRASTAKGHLRKGRGIARDPQQVWTEDPPTPYKPRTKNSLLVTESFKKSSPSVIKTSLAIDKDSEIYQGQGVASSICEANGGGVWKFKNKLITLERIFWISQPFFKVRARFLIDPWCSSVRTNASLTPPLDLRSKVRRARQWPQTSEGDRQSKVRQRAKARFSIPNLFQINRQGKIKFLNLFGVATYPPYVCEANVRESYLQITSSLSTDLVNIGKFFLPVPSPVGGSSCKAKGSVAKRKSHSLQRGFNILNQQDQLLRSRKGCPQSSQPLQNRGVNQSQSHFGGLRRSGSQQSQKMKKMSAEPNNSNFSEIKTVLNLRTFSKITSSPYLFPGRTHFYPLCCKARAARLLKRGATRITSCSPYLRSKKKNPKGLLCKWRGASNEVFQGGLRGRSKSVLLNNNLANLLLSKNNQFLKGPHFDYKVDIEVPNLFNFYFYSLFTKNTINKELSKTRGRTARCFAYPLFRFAKQSKEDFALQTKGGKEGSLLAMQPQNFNKICSPYLKNEFSDKAGPLLCPCVARRPYPSNALLLPYPCEPPLLQSKERGQSKGNLLRKENKQGLGKGGEALWGSTICVLPLAKGKGRKAKPLPSFATQTLRGFALRPLPCEPPLFAKQRTGAKHTPTGRGCFARGKVKRGVRAEQRTKKLSYKLRHKKEFDLFFLFSALGDCGARDKGLTNHYKLNFLYEKGLYYYMLKSNVNLGHQPLSHPFWKVPPHTPSLLCKGVRAGGAAEAAPPWFRGKRYFLPASPCPDVSCKTRFCKESSKIRRAFRFFDSRRCSFSQMNYKVFERFNNLRKWFKKANIFKRPFPFLLRKGKKNLKNKQFHKRQLSFPRTFPRTLSSKVRLIPSSQFFSFISKEKHINHSIAQAKKREKDLFRKLSQQDFNILLKQGWFYYTKNFSNFFLANQKLIQPGKKIGSSFVFDKHSVYIEIISVSCSCSGSLARPLPYRRCFATQTCPIPYGPLFFKRQSKRKGGVKTGAARKQRLPLAAALPVVLTSLERKNCWKEQSSGQRPLPPNLGAALFPTPTGSSKQSKALALPPLAFPCVAKRGKARGLSFRRTPLGDKEDLLPPLKEGFPKRYVSHKKGDNFYFCKTIKNKNCRFCLELENSPNSKNQNLEFMLLIRKANEFKFFNELEVKKEIYHIAKQKNGGPVLYSLNKTKSPFFIYMPKVLKRFENQVFQWATLLPIVRQNGLSFNNLYSFYLPYPSFSHFSISLEIKLESYFNYYLRFPPPLKDFHSKAIRDGSITPFCDSTKSPFAQGLLQNKDVVAKPLLCNRFWLEILRFHKRGPPYSAYVRGANIGGGRGATNFSPGFVFLAKQIPFALSLRSKKGGIGEKQGQPPRPQNKNLFAFGFPFRVFSYKKKPKGLALHGGEAPQPPFGGEPNLLKKAFDFPHPLCFAPKRGGRGRKASMRTKLGAANSIKSALVGPCPPCKATPRGGSSCKAKGSEARQGLCSATGAKLSREATNPNPGSKDKIIGHQLPAIRDLGFNSFCRIKSKTMQQKFLNKRYNSVTLYSYYKTGLLNKQKITLQSISKYQSSHLKLISNIFFDSFLCKANCLKKETPKTWAAKPFLFYSLPPQSRPSYFKGRLRPIEDAPPLGGVRRCFPDLCEATIGKAYGGTPLLLPYLFQSKENLLRKENKPVAEQGPCCPPPCGCKARASSIGQGPRTQPRFPLVDFVNGAPAFCGFATPLACKARGPLRPLLCPGRPQRGRGGGVWVFLRKKPLLCDRGTYVPQTQERSSNPLFAKQGVAKPHKAGVSLPHPLPPIPCEPPLLQSKERGQSKGVALSLRSKKGLLRKERSNFLLCFANQRGTKQRGWGCKARAMRLSNFDLLPENNLVQQPWQPLLKTMLQIKKSSSWGLPVFPILSLKAMNLFPFILSYKAPYALDFPFKTPMCFFSEQYQPTFNFNILWKSKSNKQLFAKQRGCASLFCKTVLPTFLRGAQKGKGKAAPSLGFGQPKSKMRLPIIRAFAPGGRQTNLGCKVRGLALPPLPCEPPLFAKQRLGRALLCNWSKNTKTRIPSPTEGGGDFCTLSNKELQSYYFKKILSNYLLTLTKFSTDAFPLALQEEPLQSQGEQSKKTQKRLQFPLFLRERQPGFVFLAKQIPFALSPFFALQQRGFARIGEKQEPSFLPLRSKHEVLAPQQGRFLPLPPFGGLGERSKGADPHNPASCLASKRQGSPTFVLSTKGAALLTLLRPYPSEGGGRPLVCALKLGRNGAPPFPGGGHSKEALTALEFGKTFSNFSCFFCEPIVEYSLVKDFAKSIIPLPNSEFKNLLIGSRTAPLLPALPTPLLAKQGPIIKGALCLVNKREGKGPTVNQNRYLNNKKTQNKEAVLYKTEFISFINNTVNSQLPVIKTYSYSSIEGELIYRKKTFKKDCYISYPSISQKIYTDLLLLKKTPPCFALLRKGKQGLDWATGCKKTAQLPFGGLRTPPIPPIPYALPPFFALQTKGVRKEGEQSKGRRDKAKPLVALPFGRTCRDKENQRRSKVRRSKGCTPLLERHGAQGQEKRGKKVAASSFSFSIHKVDRREIKQKVSLQKIIQQNFTDYFLANKIVEHVDNSCMILTKKDQISYSFPGFVSLPPRATPFVLLPEPVQSNPFPCEATLWGQSKEIALPPKGCFAREGVALHGGVSRAKGERASSGSLPPLVAKQGASSKGQSKVKAKAAPPYCLASQRQEPFKVSSVIASWKRAAPRPKFPFFCFSQEGERRGFWPPSLLCKVTESKPKFYFGLLKGPSFAKQPIPCFNPPKGGVGGANRGFFLQSQGEQSKAQKWKKGKWIEEGNQTLFPQLRSRKGKISGHNTRSVQNYKENYLTLEKLKKRNQYVINNIIIYILNLLEDSNLNSNQVVELNKMTAGLSQQKSKLLIGEFLVYGDKIASNLSISKGGQIIHINNKKITLRQGQPIFVSPQAILHKYDGDFIDEQSAVITLAYQQLKTGDIVQGIPKIEQFFEARTTKRGRLFRDSLENLLKAIFNRYNSKLSREQAVRQSFYKIQQIIIDGVQRVYRSQGVTIADKHLEVIVKQMTSKVRITFGGSTGYLPGEICDLYEIELLNKELRPKIMYEPIVLGITKASLEVKSFLSAASFQQTTRVLSKSALARKNDYLNGLKENVILGNLIPAGTGYLVYLDQSLLDFSKIERLKSSF